MTDKPTTVDARDSLLKCAQSNIWLREQLAEVRAALARSEAEVERSLMGHRYSAARAHELAERAEKAEARVAEVREALTTWSRASHANFHEAEVLWEECERPTCVQARAALDAADKLEHIYYQRFAVLPDNDRSGL